MKPASELVGRVDSEFPGKSVKVEHSYNSVRIEREVNEHPSTSFCPGQARVLALLLTEAARRAEEWIDHD